MTEEVGIRPSIPAFGSGGAVTPPLLQPEHSSPLAAAKLVRLDRLDERLATMIVAWVRTDESLRLLAPGTPPPLTTEKVLAWRKPEGRIYALMGWAERLLGYGELNRMGDSPSHWWLGHFVINPDFRRRGLGAFFIGTLVREGFDALGSTRISLIVFRENQAARSCYARAGFRLVGEEIREFRPGDGPRRVMRMEHTGGGTRTRRHAIAPGT